MICSIENIIVCSHYNIYSDIYSNIIYSCWFFDYLTYKLCHNFCLFVYSLTESHCLAQASLDLIILHGLTECWDYGCVLPHLIYFFFFICLFLTFYHVTLQTFTKAQSILFQQLIKSLLILFHLFYNHFLQHIEKPRYV